MGMQEGGRWRRCAHLSFVAVPLCPVPSSHAATDGEDEVHDGSLFVGKQRGRRDRRRKHVREADERLDRMLAAGGAGHGEGLRACRGLELGERGKHQTIAAPWCHAASQPSACATLVCWVESCAADSDGLAAMAGGRAAESARRSALSAMFTEDDSVAIFSALCR